MFRVVSDNLRKNALQNKGKLAISRVIFHDFRVILTSGGYLLKIAE